LKAAGGVGTALGGVAVTMAFGVPGAVVGVPAFGAGVGTAGLGLADILNSITDANPGYQTPNSFGDALGGGYLGGTADALALASDLAGLGLIGRGATSLIDETADVMVNSSDELPSILSLSDEQFDEMLSEMTKHESSWDDAITDLNNSGEILMMARKRQQEAYDLGYTKYVKDPPFDSHGEPVYTNGKNYITPDNTGHKTTNGWKMFDRHGERIATYNSDLSKCVGK
jgi:hypothetical protein